MTPDKTTQAIESTEENRAEAGPSRSRRGFLKQTAVASLVGVTGLSAATEAVDARPPRNRVIITGVDERTSYTLYTTGKVRGGEGNDSIHRIRRKLDDGRIYHREINGWVFRGHQDVYDFRGYVYIERNRGINSRVIDRG